MAETATRLEASRAPIAERRCPTCGSKYPLDFKVCPKDETRLELPEIGDDDPLIGEILAGTFCITGLLGAGGMGRVYEAEHVRLPRRFAVKVISESLAMHEEAVSRFEREAQAVARIEHEHVVDIVDVVRTRDGRPCIVTELLRGEEMGDLLDRQGKLGIDTAIGLCRQICRGLAAAHAAGVVHRDLKPSNLFVLERSDGTLWVKILDFGVAKVTDGANLTKTGVIIGTPAYMAPEQARGSPDVDARADVYAVGAVLYRMLTGLAPFSEDDPTDTLKRLLTEDPPRPRALEKRIPEGLEHLIQSAMARVPAERPATVRDLERQLASFDELSGPRSVGPASTDRLALATADTAMIMPQGPGGTSEDPVDVTKRARRARPRALAMVGVSSLCFGGSAIALGSSVVHGVSRRPTTTPTETTLLMVLGGLAFIMAFSGSMRALSARWRSAPAVDRIASGLAAGVATLLGGTGIFALAWHTAAVILGAKSLALGPLVEIGSSGLPALLAAIVCVASFRRAAVSN